MKEKSLSKKLIDWLNSLPGTYAEKRLARQGQRGRPDITGCSQCIRLEIESKVYDDKPTSAQKYWLALWKRVGAVSFWGNDLEKMKAEFKKQMAEKGIKI